MRFICAPQKWIFFKAPLNLVDLLAILPYFVSFVMEEMKVSFKSNVTTRQTIPIIKLLVLQPNSQNTLKKTTNKV